MNRRRSARNKIETKENNQEGPMVDEIKNRKRVASKHESNSDSDEPLKEPEIKGKGKKKRTVKPKSDDDGSSSDSSVGNYLQNPDELDLNSSFFETNKDKPPDFDTIEKQIFSGVVQSLSDSADSDEELVDEEKNLNFPAGEKNNFAHIQKFNENLDDLKECVAQYQKRKSAVEDDLNVNELLLIGEKNDAVDVKDEIDSEDEMDWEEIEDGVAQEEEKNKIEIPKEGVQITVSMPQVIKKKKKGVDLLAAIKRRINRIKKENQLYVHKVHLLCWIAHGNIINTYLNNESLLATSLSLIPSENCYPPKHADISYLEQIVKWYGKMMKLKENMPSNDLIPVLESLQNQINKKEAISKRDFVFIFIIILRSLGLQCRLILSLQVLPLRPPNSELCVVSTKEEKKKVTDASTSKETITKSGASTSRSNENTKKSSASTSKTNKKECVKNTVSSSNKTNKKINKKECLKDAVSSSKETNKKSSQIKAKPELIKSKENNKTPQKLPIKAKSIKINTSKEDIKKPSKTENAQLSTEINKIKSKTQLSPDINKIKSKLRSSNDTKTSNKTSTQTSNKTELNKKETIKNPSKNEDNNKTKRTKENSTKSSKSSRTGDKKTTQSDTKNKKTTDNNTRRSQRQLKLSQVDGMNDSDNEQPSTSSQPKKPNLSTLKSPPPDSPKPCISKRHRNTVKKYVDSSESDFESRDSSLRRKDINANRSKSLRKSPKKQLDVRKDIMNIIKGGMVAERNQEKRKSVKHDESDYDSDYLPEEPVEKKRKSTTGKGNSEDEFKIKVNTNVKRRVKPRKELDRRVLSTDSDDSMSKNKKKVGNDVWVEVFLEAEEKWISVDVIKGQVHCISELHSRASQPVSYILAWNNNFSVKDVTARYCPNWNTVTRKLRVDKVWWNESLKPYIGRKTARDKEEDEDLARQQLDQPLPKTINEYKNHPLYVLKRHLLKFEAIYPPDAVTLGFVRGEPVYARECVYTLHSREIWVKHAKVVKPGQQPYKIVKARPKYDRLTGSVTTDIPLEIFGIWQVQDYVPPTAENGVVPRNAFGNVELFKSCMLPFKTVHLQLPGLNKIARKLRIDCAPAVVGFDFHCGGSHPTFDGYVVCEEFKDQLIQAWEEDQAETAKREQEKYDKRVWGNWRKLIKAVLIRERLKARYDFGDLTAGPKDKKGKKKEVQVQEKKRRICSDESESE